MKPAAPGGAGREAADAGREAPPLRVLGDERALALAGLRDAAPDGPAVHLGDPAEAPDPDGVVWLPHPAATPPPEGMRVIATAGDGLWSRAPWPARDELFELAPAPEPHALVVCDDEERRDLVVGKLAGLHLPVTGAPHLTVEGLAAASAVALLGDAGAATPEAPWAATAMPGEAPAVLAARRILVAPRTRLTLGLLPGTDHLAFGTNDDVVHYLGAVLTFPRSFEPFEVLGARTAERHRASRVYARLAAELTSAPRSAAPRG